MSRYLAPTYPFMKAPPSSGQGVRTRHVPVTGYTYVEPHEDGQFLRHADVAGAEHLRESVADESKSRYVTHIQEETILRNGGAERVRGPLRTSIPKCSSVFDRSRGFGYGYGCLEAEGADGRLRKGYP